MQILSVEKHNRGEPQGSFRYGRVSAKAWREYNWLPRIYVSVKSETIIDNLANRRDRPSKLYRSVLKPAFIALGLNPNEVSAHWSQKAGCSCGCSPGFIVKSVYSVGFPKADVWVTVTGDDAVIEGQLQSPTAVADAVIAEQAAANSKE